MGNLVVIARRTALCFSKPARSPFRKSIVAFAYATMLRLLRTAAYTASRSASGVERIVRLHCACHSNADSPRLKTPTPNWLWGRRKRRVPWGEMQAL